jgi:uncharacterized membrane protein (Fun14 family)
MEPAAPHSVETAARRSFAQWLRDMPRWKQAALGVALGAAVVGAIGMLASGDAGVVPPAGTGGRTDLTADFVPTTGGGQPPGTQPPANEPAARGVFRLGFSFIAGFCVGTFVRTTARLVAIAVGFWLTMTIVLSYYGLVVVDWIAIEGVWDRFAANVEREWGNLTSFLTGSLPTAGLATAGLAAGLKKH